MLPRINTLWVQGRLSYIERLCLQSMLDVGHEVTLFTYHGVDNVPDGIKIEDGRNILPEQKLIRFEKNGSYALGANIFRYAMMKSNIGIWLDLDIYCVKPIEIKGDYLFGREEGSSVNNAVLYLAPESIILNDLLEFCCKKPFIPPWWPAWKKKLQHTRSLFDKDLPPAKLEWGVLGPRALTYFINNNNLLEAAQPCDVFYPIELKDARKMFDPDEDMQKLLSENTVSIHLWNTKIKKQKTTSPPEGCFIHHLCQKHNIHF